MSAVTITMQTGYGSESNVYPSPSASYVDLADPSTPTINPVVQSGTYIPIGATSEIRWGVRDESHFKLHYDFAGKFYTDKALKNGNELSHRIYIGGMLDQDTSRGFRYWSSRFVIERHEQDAYDRDTGDTQSAGADDITDRLNYTKLGPRIFYDRQVGQIGWGLKGSTYIRNSTTHSTTSISPKKSIKRASTSHIDHGEVRKSDSWGRNETDVCKPHDKECKRCAIQQQQRSRVRLHNGRHLS